MYWAIATSDIVFFDQYCRIIARVKRLVLCASFLNPMVVVGTGHCRDILFYSTRPRIRLFDACAWKLRSPGYPFSEESTVFASRSFTACPFGQRFPRMAWLENHKWGKKREQDLPNNWRKTVKPAGEKGISEWLGSQSHEWDYSRAVLVLLKAYDPGNKLQQQILSYSEYNPRPNLIEFAFAMKSQRGSDRLAEMMWSSGSPNVHAPWRHLYCPNWRLLCTRCVS